MKSFFLTLIHQTTIMYTLQQNRRVERKHCHILNVAWALCFQAPLPPSFSGKRVKTAVYLINRTPSFILNGKTPFEILFSKIPSLSFCRFSGVYALLIIVRLISLRLLVSVVFFLFTYMERKCGHFIILKPKKIVSRNVEFIED